MARPDPKALVGRTLGGMYRLRRHVASGGFADLYEAWHEELETPVAVKVRRDAAARTDQAEARAQNDDYCFAHFKTEAILGFRLRDPHVVRVLDFRLEATVEYLVMEWLEGKSLQTLADGRPMYWRRAVELVAKAAEAVASLHAAGWLHRDIKPDNFMVIGEGDDERVVLIDLGLVRQRPLAAPIVSQLAEPTAWIAHTPGYCAPEVFAQVGQTITTSPFSEASEVFALGVTLYKLITARIPWPGHTPQQQQVEIGVGAPPIPPHEFGVRLPGELERLLMRSLGADPAQRPGSALAFAQELRRLLAPSRPARDVATARPPEAPASRSASMASETAAAHPRWTEPRPPPSRPRGRRWSRRWAPLALALASLPALALVVLDAPTPAQLDRDEEPIRGPAPAPLAVVQPDRDEEPIRGRAPAPLEVVQPDVARVVATRPETRPEPAPPRRRESLPEQLRRCPGAPAGAVVLEVRGGRLVSVDFEELIEGDPWHRCAARRLAGARDGRQIVNL